jgi:hypothetical protein
MSLNLDLDSQVMNLHYSDINTGDEKKMAHYEKKFPE